MDVALGDAAGGSSASSATSATGSAAGAAAAVVGSGGTIAFGRACQAVYRLAVETMAQSTARLLSAAGLPVSAVDWLVCHQANRRILDAVAARLEIPPSRCLTNIDQVGNTSAASIPLALSYGARSEALRPGDRVVLTGFGGGLAWGSTLLRWPEIVCDS